MARAAEGPRQGPEPFRQVYCQDALAWLAEQGAMTGCSMVTSLPDWSEFPATPLPVWKEWFESAAQQVLRACCPQGVSLFYQTDIKVEGAWVDKAYLCQKAAEAAGQRLLWHKIVCRTAPGNPTSGRPGYSHLLCFSQSLSAPVQLSFPDVLPEGGARTWARGMGLETCRWACRYVRQHTACHTVVAPFCGQGLVLAVANELGLKAIGVEKSPKRARQARMQSLGPSPTGL